MSRLFEQALLFGTDLFGLERLLRGLQATALILEFYPALLTLVLPLLTVTSSTTAFAASEPITIAKALLTLGPLKAQLNLVRRYLRTFKFIESYVLAYRLLVGPAAPGSQQGRSLEAYLDILYGSFMGTFGLLETVTLPDMTGIPGLDIFGSERAAALNVEAQRLWFLALACSVLSGGVKMLKLFALAPVPVAGEAYGGAAKEGAKEKQNGKVIGEEDKEADGKTETQEKNGAAGNAGSEDWRAERDRLKAIVDGRKKRRKEIRSRAKFLARKMVTDGFDMVIPGTVVGWVGADVGAVGVVMLFTTFTSSVDVWDKCGRQIVARGEK